MNEEKIPWIQVFQSPGYQSCFERALVLAALEVDHRIIRQEEACVLLVPPEAASRAQVELEAYEAENRGWPPLEEVPRQVASALPGILGYCTLLIAGFEFAHYQVFGLDWWEAGRTQAGLIRGGEWWRGITALSLHADLAHLAGNLVFGSLFGAFLCHQLGTGLAWFSILLTGVLGNLLNALIQPPLHTSVGASTGVFGAIGVLAALQWSRRRAQPHPLRRWSPLIIGAVFLGFLGTSGESTDVVAHITGILSGTLWGLLFGNVARRLELTPRQQLALSWVTPLLLGLAWAVALTS